MNYDLCKKQVQWSEFVAFSYQMGDPAFIKAAEEVGRWFMNRARHNIEVIVKRLTESGYRFLANNPYQPPSAHIKKDIATLESKGLHLPFSLRLWFEEIGSVNLMGSHPDWHHPAYLFEHKMPEDRIVWLTEPLVIDPFLEESYDQWQAIRDDPNRSSQPVAPFRVEIAPDDLHKANISGGDSISMDAHTPQVEGLVLNERHCVGFLAYLRIVFQWGGFPGFERYPDAPKEFIDELVRDLFPL